MDSALTGFLGWYGFIFTSIIEVAIIYKAVTCEKWAEAWKYILTVVLYVPVLFLALCTIFFN